MVGALTDAGCVTVAVSDPVVTAHAESIEVASIAVDAKMSVLRTVSLPMF